MKESIKIKTNNYNFKFRVSGLIIAIYFNTSIDYLTGLTDEKKLIKGQ